MSHRYCYDCQSRCDSDDICRNCLDNAERAVMDAPQQTSHQFAARQKRRFRQAARLVWWGLIPYLALLILLYTCGEDPFGPMARIGRLFMHTALILSFYKWAMAVPCTAEEVLNGMAPAGQPTTDNRPTMRSPYTPLPLGHDYKVGDTMAWVYRIPGEPDVIRQVTLLKPDNKGAKWQVRTASGYVAWVPVAQLRSMAPAGQPTTEQPTTGDPGLRRG